MRYGSKPGKIEKLAGESGFFYRHDPKVGHFPYIFLNSLALFLFMHISENCGKPSYVSESPSRILTGMRGKARRPVKSGFGAVSCPNLQTLRGDLWGGEPYFKVCGGGILFVFIKT